MCVTTTQVAEYYGGITGLRLPPQLQRELGKPMAAHLGIKAGLYAAYTLLHQAAVFIADDECGQQIACLQVRRPGFRVQGSLVVCRAAESMADDERAQQIACLQVRFGVYGLIVDCGSRVRAADRLPACRRAARQGLGCRVHLLTTLPSLSTTTSAGSGQQIACLQELVSSRRCPELAGLRCTHLSRLVVALQRTRPLVFIHRSPFWRKEGVFM